MNGLKSQVQIKPKCGTGPALVVQTGRSAEYYREQLDAFRCDNGIHNDIEIGIFDNPGFLPLSEVGKAPCDMKLCWWELLREDPTEIEICSDVADNQATNSPEQSKGLGWVDEKSIKKHACNACIKYWARAPDEEGNWENCRKYMKTPNDLPIVSQLLYYVCREKVRIECAELAKVSQTEDEESLMKYLTTNHRGNYNQRVHGKDGPGYGEGWYTERGKQLIAIICKYLETRETECGHRRIKSTPEDLQRLRAHISQSEGFENWYSPDKYSFTYRRTDPIYENLLSSQVIEDLHSIVHNHADPDWRIKGDWSNAIHKDIMERFVHMVKENSKLATEVENYKNEVKTLKQANSELRRRNSDLENEKLKSRRPGAKRGMMQRRSQSIGNEYAKEYKTKRRPLEAVRTDEN